MAIILLGVGGSSAAAAVFTLSPGEYGTTAIVCAKNNAVATFAAGELQKHLALITGYTFPVSGEKANFKKVFYVGLIPAQDTKPLKNEESRYLVNEDAVYMYGEDHVSSFENKIVMLSNKARTGTLFSVYSFLENELGVDWVEPGDGGIMYEKKDRLSVPARFYSWTSPLKYQRGLRMYQWEYEGINGRGQDPVKVMPVEFRSSLDEVDAKKAESELWQKRMGMGTRGASIPLGHAFTEWWVKYGTEHPEYFALNGKGKREPIGKPITVKMDPSEPKLAGKLVEEWWSRKGEPNWKNSINACEDDGGGYGLDEFCHCDKCIALDALKPGEKFGANLTDRYLDFMNRVAGLARQHDPEAVVGGYAYGEYTTPPRVLRVADGVVLGFVTGFEDDWAKTSAIYEGWKKAGLKEIIFRPNDLWNEIGMPMGLEKRVLEHFQLARKCGAEGTDFDGYNSLWTGVSGFTYYVISKAHQDPAKPFEFWENKYVSLFGAAKDDIKAFHRYWREEIFDKRLYPPNAVAKSAGRGGYLSWSNTSNVYAQHIGKYYNERDFDTTDGYLKAALTKRLSPVQRQFISRMLIANMHSRLTYRAMLAYELKDKAALEQAAKDLVAYRLAHKNELYMNWPQLFIVQTLYGDVTGTKALQSQK